MKQVNVRESVLSLRDEWVKALTYLKEWYTNFDKIVWDGVCPLCFVADMGRGAYNDEENTGYERSECYFCVWTYFMNMNCEKYHDKYFEGKVGHSVSKTRENAKKYPAWARLRTVQIGDWITVLNSEVLPEDIKRGFETLKKHGHLEDMDG